MSWEKVRLVDVCDFQGGTQPPKSEWSSKKLEGYVRMIQIRDFTQGKDSFVEYVKDSSRLKKCVESDIMIGRYGASIGKILTGINGAYNVALVKTIPSEKINKRFFFHYLNTPDFQNFIQNAGSRAAQAGFNKDELSELQLLLPPLATQKCIADILDTADALRRNDQELLTKYDQLAQAIFTDMFGDPVKNEKGWEVKKLGEHIDSIRYGTGSPPEYSTFGIPFIRATNIKKGTVVEKGMVYLSDVEAQKIKKCFIKEGDLIIVRSGANTGDCAYIPAKYNGSLGGYDLIVEMDKTKSRFYNYIINSIWGKSIIEKLSRRAGQPHLNSEQVSNMELISPDYVQLQKFKKSLDVIDELKINIEKITAENTSLFSSLVQQAFNGTLVS
jgi:type I restriction enzyme S subunit